MGFERLQNACPSRPRSFIQIFSLLFIRSIPRLKRSTKSKIFASIAFECEKKVASRQLVSRISWSKKCESLGSSKKVASGFSFVGQNAYELLKDVIIEKTLIVTIDQKSCTRLLICGSESICGTVLGVVCMHVSFSFPRSTSDNCCSSIVSSRNQFKSYSN